MGAVGLEDILVTPLKRINVKGGDVLHGMKVLDPGYYGFGEAYFSIVNSGSVKAWKMHRSMTLNLIVPVGEVRFVFSLQDQELYRTETIGSPRYVRLTVPPGIWFGFQGLSSPYSLVLNVADLEHDTDEVSRMATEDFNFDWKLD